MNRILLIAVMFSLLSLSVSAAHVNGYTRRDGTHVSGYNTGSDRTTFGGTKADDAVIWMIIGGIALVVIVVAVIASSSAEKKNTEKALDLMPIQMSQAGAMVKRFRSGAFVPPDTPLVLSSGEVAVLHSASQLMEAKATRVYGGAGTRIKGISVGGGASRSVDGLSQIDSGTLTLTNMRLVFDGRMQSRTTEVGKIVTIKRYLDSIEVATAKRAKSQVYVVSNPPLWEQSIRLAVAGQIGQIRQAEVSDDPEAVAETESERDIHFACEKCGQHLAIDHEAAGKLVSCTSCGATVHIPLTSKTA